MSKVFTSIAVSLDGFIGSKTGDLSWLNDAMAKGEDYGFEENMKRKCNKFEKSGIVSLKHKFL